MTYAEYQQFVARQNGEYPAIETRAEAHEQVDKALRYKQILEILTEPMTAKEVAVEMHRRGFIPTTERNFSAPRLTEMQKDGKVEIIGKKKCEYTGKNVSVYARRNANA